MTHVSMTRYLVNKTFPALSQVLQPYKLYSTNTRLFLLNEF